MGRQGGRQEITVNKYCTIYVHIHEIFHALGYYHEHSRNDRYSYININYRNIDRDNFRNYDNKHFDSLYEYDFESLMHYPLFFNGKESITPQMVGI